MITKRSLTRLDKVIECVFEKQTWIDVIKPSELWWYIFDELFVSTDEDKLWICWDCKWCYDLDYYLRDMNTKERVSKKRHIFWDTPLQINLK